MNYSRQPNPLNAKVAWPLLELGDFSNLRPEYFNLPERGRTFKSRFGFHSWADAKAFFEIAFPEYSTNKKQKTLLQPFFQFLAALWRMKAYKSVEELASFFGLTRWKMIRNI